MPYTMSKKFPVKYVLELNGEPVSVGDTVLCPWCWRHYKYYIYLWGRFNTWYGCRKCCRKFRIKYGCPDYDDNLIDGEAEKSRECEEQLRKDGDWP